MSADFDDDRVVTQKTLYKYLNELSKEYRKLVGILGEHASGGDWITFERITGIWKR